MSNIKIITNLKPWIKHDAHTTNSKTYTISNKTHTTRNTYTSKLQNEDIKKSDVIHDQRRKLIFTGILALTQFPFQSPSKAQETNIEPENNRVFFDISVDNQPYGRIIIEIFPDVKLGSQRFLDLAIGISGVGYRLSKFDALTKVTI